MAVFIVLWPYLLTTKLRSVILLNLGHSSIYVPDRDATGNPEDPVPRAMAIFSLPNSPRNEKCNPRFPEDPDKACFCRK